MARLMQIYEDDLAELERVLPEVTDTLAQHLDNRQRVQLRRVQVILSNVRWNYGPHTDITVIPAE